MEFEKPKKIFLVDDDTMLTELMKDYLTRKVAHHVSVFNTGEEAVKHLSENPDVIVLDYWLNTVQKDAANGMEILDVVKKNYPNIHVIMLSSQEKYSVAMKTVQHGAEQYVIKGEDAFEKVASLISALNH